MYKRMSPKQVARTDSPSHHMSGLAPGVCQFHVVCLTRKPGCVGRTMPADVQGIGKQSHGQAKRQDDDEIEEGQQDARLKLADLAGKNHPAIPKFAQHGLSPGYNGTAGTVSGGDESVLVRLGA